MHCIAVVKCGSTCEHTQEAAEEDNRIIWISKIGDMQLVDVKNRERIQSDKNWGFSRTVVFCLAITRVVVRRTTRFL